MLLNPGRLVREGGGYGWGLTGGYFFNPHFALEGEFMWFRRDYVRVSDTVLPGTADDRQRYLVAGDRRVIRKRSVVRLA